MNSKIKKVFISGPMRGYDNMNKEAFFEAEEILKMAGFDVFNPAWLNFGPGFSQADIMAIDTAALSRCDYIYQLDGWERSTGAVGEWQVAKWANIKPINKMWLNWYIDKRRKRKNKTEV